MDHRLHDRVHPLKGPRLRAVILKTLRSEDAAFRLLLVVIAVFAVIIALILIVRALA